MRRPNVKVTDLSTPTEQPEPAKVVYEPKFPDKADEELQLLAQEIATELERRSLLTEATSKQDEVNRTVLNATGHAEGDAWRQPSGAHDAYPIGWQVTHNGKLWESLRHANPDEPGVASWREIVEGGGPTEWVQPTSAEDAYDMGDQVIFNGQVYKSLRDDNVWSPDTVVSPAIWQLVEEPAPTPTEPTVEEPPGPEPTAPAAEWVPYDAAAVDSPNPYSTGDRVTYNGLEYQSTIDNNTWSPEEYPQGWEQV